VLPILTQIIQDNQAKTKLLRFVSSDDPFVAVELSRLFWLHFSSPEVLFCYIKHAMYKPMQRSEDLTDYNNHLNLVQMELEQLLKPLDEFTLVVALSQGLRGEFKTAAQLLSIGVVDAITLDDAVQHMQDSMLIVTALAETPISAFLANATPVLASQAITQNAIVAQLSTLIAQMKSLDEYVVAVAASSSRPSRGGDHREPIICSYCDKLGHTESDCYTRQRDEKCKAEVGASNDKVVVPALVCPPAHAAGVP
jgi:predicted RNA-binding protein YlxR (DUF448 family)